MRRWIAKRPPEAGRKLTRTFRDLLFKIFEYSYNSGVCTAAHPTLADRTTGVDCSIKRVQQFLKLARATEVETNIPFIGRRTIDPLIFETPRDRKNGSDTSSEKRINQNANYFAGSNLWDKISTPRTETPSTRIQQSSGSTTEEEVPKTTAVKDEQLLFPAAEEKPQSEKAGKPETAQTEPPELTTPQSVAVFRVLTELGVPPVVALRDAAKAPVEALAVLAMVYRIEKRGGIRNPAGLARAALRNPERYLPNWARNGPECVPRERPISEPLRVASLDAELCLYCGKPPDEDGWSGGMHFRCDEKSRG